MLLISIVLLLIAIIAILIFFIALKVDFTFDTIKENMNVTIFWLYPFLKAEIFIEKKVPILKVFLFNIKVYKKTMGAKSSKKKSKNGIQFVKDIKFNDINLTAHYGFQDKFLVGIVCGLINFISQFLQVDYLEQSPDFLENNDYIYIKATAKVSIVPTLKSLAQH